MPRPGFRWHSRLGIDVLVTESIADNPEPDVAYKGRAFIKGTARYVIIDRGRL